MSPAALIPALLALLLPVSGSAGSDPEEIDFARLSDFDYVEGMTLPKHVTTLDDKTITISGFMRREFDGTGPVEYFMLINDACGCDGTPFLNEVLFCTMPEGETVEIEPGIVSVTGRFYAGETKEDGYVVSLYDMDVDSIGD